MGYFDAQFITDKGTELLARSTAGEGDIIFTSMHTGDGEYSLGEISSITSVDGLKDEKGIFPINDVDSKGENTRVRATISNQGLEEGYYIKEIGLYAKMENEAEVLFSVSVCREKPTFLPEMQDVPIELPVTNYVSYSGDGDFTLEYRSDVYATLDMVQRLSSDIQNDIKTVKEGILDTIQTAYENANQFALTKIAELVNGAPTTMDTLKEIADVIAANKSVVDALDTAIGSKANQAELDTHVNNSNIHFTASERQQLGSLVSQFGSKANAVAPLGCSTLPSNLLSYCSKYGLSYSSTLGYYNLYSEFSDNLNTQFVTAAGTGYRIEKSGYYNLRIQATITGSCSATSAVKRTGIRVGSNTGSWLLQALGRLQTWESLNDSSDVHLGAGTILVPIFNMDSNGSTVTTATVDVVMRILPLFIKN